VLIGGLAATEHGSPEITNDLDICYARDDENLERLAAALRELGAVLRGAPDDVPFILDARTLGAGDHFTFRTTAGPLDILGTPSGARGYEEMEATAEAMEIFGIRIQVVSLDDLISMKLAAGRLKDLVSVEILQALRDEREDR
jgi:hypothetical protein